MNNFNKNGSDEGDFKRSADAAVDQDSEEELPLNEKAQEYIRELLAEKHKADEANLKNSTRLLDLELSRVQTSGRPHKDCKYVDVYREKPVNIKVKVLVPVKENPKFNFIGNLLGPKGHTVKALQEETLCKIAIFGRGSMRDKNEEAKLRVSLEPKYAHLSDELHVEIATLAPPAEAYARMAFALDEVRKYLVPELSPDHQFQDGGLVPRGHGPPQRGRPPRGHPAQVRSLMPHKQAPSYGSPPPRPTGRDNKVITILKKARAAMGIPSPPQQPYEYDDQFDAPPSEEDCDSYYDDPSAPAQQRDFYSQTPNAITTEHDSYYSREDYDDAPALNRRYKQGGRGAAGNQQQAARGRRGLGPDRGAAGSVFERNPYSRPKQ